MKIGQPKLMLDLYDWLPPYGESKITIRTEETNLIIKIDYEHEKENGQIDNEFKELIFYSTPYFIKRPIPCISVFEHFSGDKKVEPGVLLEYQLSEFRDQAMQRELEHGRNRGKSLKHYLVAFLAENIVVDILAENFELK